MLANFLVTLNHPSSESKPSPPTVITVSMVRPFVIMNASAKNKKITLNRITSNCAALLETKNMIKNTITNAETIVISIVFPI